MNIKHYLSVANLYVSLLVFISFAIFILCTNQEVFYTAHDRSEFLFGTTFFYSLLSKPFGLIQYVGAWLTQLFCIPTLGVGVLLFIWALIFFVGVKAFRLRSHGTALMLLPVACLLLSLVDLGYWIYVSPIKGYWFSQSLGYLFMVLLLWAGRSTPRKWHCIWYLVAFLIYPILGWFAMLFVLCLIVCDKPSWRELLGVIVLIFTIFIWHTQFYSHLKFSDVAWAGFPRFVTSNNFAELPSLPFWVLGIVSLVICICGRYLTKLFVPVLSTGVCIIFVSTFMYHDKNYIDEMRMIRYAETNNWKEVIDIASDVEQPTNTMNMLKNVALMNEGGLLDRSFKMGNINNAISKSDSLHVSFLNIASPLVYYNYGLVNEATRLCFEDAIQYGFSPFYLKVLSQCALAKGDKKLVDRYTTLLQHRPFYSDWQPRAVGKIVNDLQYSYDDEITGVENTESFIVNSISVWSKANSKVASEQKLFYSMISCDSHRFWPSLRNYLKVHVNEAFPIHAQEAYILFMDKAPEEKRMMIPVEQSVYERYKQFTDTLGNLAKPGLTIGDVAKQMSKDWGDTYWYYFFFGRNA